MFIQSNMLQIGKRPNGFVFPNNRYSEYAFYWQPGGVDKVSKQALSGGTIDDGYLSTYGNYTVLNSYSNDISNDYWVKDAGVTISGTNGFQAGAIFDYVHVGIDTQEEVLYTISFYAYVEFGGQLDNYGIKHYNSGGLVQTEISLSYTRTRYFATVSGTAGGGVINFGFRDNNTSNWSKVYIDTINVTEDAYAMPPAENNEAGEFSVPYTYADSTQGPKFQMTPDEIGSVYTGDVEGDDLITDTTQWDDETRIGITQSAPNVFDFNVSVWTVVRYIPITGFINGYTYEVSFTLLNYVSGECSVYINGNSGQGITEVNNETYIIRGLAEGSAAFGFQLGSSSLDGTIKINYIKKVSRNMGMPKLIDSLDGIADGDDQRPASPIWSSATGWTDDGYTATVDGSHTQNFLQLPSTGTDDATKYFEVSYTVGEITAGSFGLKVSNNEDEDDNKSLRTINGTYIMRSHGGTVDNVQVTCVAGTVGSLTVNYIKEISPAQGELVVEWMPMFDWDVITTSVWKDILHVGSSSAIEPLRFTSNGTSAWAIVFDDGPTAVSIGSVSWQAETLYTIKAIWGTTHPTYPGVSKMQLIITDGTTTWTSIVVDFDGSFDPGDFKSFGWGNEYWQKIKSSKLLKEATSWV